MFFRLANRVARYVDYHWVSSSRYKLIKAEGLRQYGHFDEALIEAEKARDDKNATALDNLYAKSKMIQIMNEKSKHEGENKPSNLRPR